MRTTLILVFLSFSAAGASAGAAYPPPWGTHVRALTPAAAALLADAISRSTIVKDLVEDLGHTDVVVYVSDGVDEGDRELPAYLVFVASAAGTRYLMVRIERWLVAPWDRIARLAHELQHALEIAGAPEVTDRASLARFYRRIGWEGQRNRFETQQARATGNRVRDQIAGFHR